MQAKFSVSCQDSWVKFVSVLSNVKHPESIDYIESSQAIMNIFQSLPLGLLCTWGLNQYRPHQLSSNHKKKILSNSSSHRRTSRNSISSASKSYHRSRKTLRDDKVDTPQTPRGRSGGSGEGKDKMFPLVVMASRTPSDSSGSASFDCVSPTSNPKEKSSVASSSTPSSKTAIRRSNNNSIIRLCVSNTVQSGKDGTN